MKKKFICTVCGYIYEGTEAPEKCPICKAPASKFKEMEDAVDDDMTFATVHVLGQAFKDSVNEDVIKGLKDHFNGECGEVGMYLAMARQADREGYPEIAEAYKRYAYEEADHASRFAELLGEVLGDTKSNLEARIAAEKGACEDKFRIAKLAKEQGSDAIHDTVHEMAKDEARHCAGFAGLYKRYFKELILKDVTLKIIILFSIVSQENRKADSCIVIYLNRLSLCDDKYCYFVSGTRNLSPVCLISSLAYFSGYPGRTGVAPNP